jgi:tetratricopeptide (TPR) repeat protein
MEAVSQSALKPVTQRPAFVIAVLLGVAILGFVLVSRLVNRYQQQQKALARHLYDQGLNDQAAGRFDNALESFRAALIYDRDNFQYQLSLARALRDSGRTEESETYLISLWERNPQDSAVNLALGRLASRQGQVDRAMQFYHNAIYGVWTTNANQNRLNAQFELVDFLLRQGARPQAQAELITLSASEPSDEASQLRVAQLMARAQDYEHALAAYQLLLKHDRENLAALTGAGDAAYHLNHFRTASNYLQAANKADPTNVTANQLLQQADFILQTDPFARHLSGADRMGRARLAFSTAGDRLGSCAQALKVDLTASSSSANALALLSARWQDLKPKLAKDNPAGEDDILNAAMDLVSDIEQQTASVCGLPNGTDQALMLMSQDRNGVER